MRTRPPRQHNAVRIAHSSASAQQHRQRTCQAQKNCAGRSKHIVAFFTSCSSVGGGANKALVSRAGASRAGAAAILSACTIHLLALRARSSAAARARDAHSAACSRSVSSPNGVGRSATQAVRLVRGGPARPASDALKYDVRHALASSPPSHPAAVLCRSARRPLCRARPRFGAHRQPLACSEPLCSERGTPAGRAWRGARARRRRMAAPQARCAAPLDRRRRATLPPTVRLLAVLLGLLLAARCAGEGGGCFGVRCGAAHGGSGAAADACEHSHRNAPASERAWPTRACARQAARAWTAPRALRRPAAAAR